MTPRTAQRGFTLIEVLVASVIFAVIMSVGFVALQNATGHRDAVDDTIERFAEIQRAVQLMSRDLSQVQPRSVRDLLGSDRVPALTTGTDGGGIEMTTGGWANPAGLSRSVLQRVGYQIEEDILYRVQWPVLDRTQGTLPTRRPVLEGVQGLQVRFFDSQGNDSEDWPPLSGGGPGTSFGMRPRAVEFSFQLEDYGLITRLVELA
ncbi:MAG: type II secretion system minor pseudopilin GspJ, partial [Pseudomonadota bacterium]